MPDQNRVDEVIYQEISKLNNELVNMQRELAKKNAEIALNQERYQAISELMSDYAYALEVRPDTAPVYTWVTDSCQRMTGYTAAQVLAQKHLTAMAHPDDVTALESALQRILQDGTTMALEYRMIRQNGVILYISNRLRPVWNDREKRITHVYGAIRDITEIRKAEEQAMRLRVEQERVKMLADFISHASHEFRTPLATISTSTYLLNRTAEDEHQKRHLKKIDDQIISLATLIEGLTTMTRLDVVSDMLVEPVDFCEVIETVQNIMRKPMEAKQLRLTLEMGESSLSVMGDIDDLRRAVACVWGNAIRYTPSGGEITVRCESVGDEIVVEVTDTGVGIAPEHLPHIWERYYRVDTAGTTRGFGLGLTIAQRIVERHGGRIDVESAPDTGSTFRLVFPMAAPAPR